jgi:hypothetical protein
VRVPTDQPLGDWSTLLLEPESDESFFAWGMFPEVLQRVEYIEGYAIAPLAEKMLAADPALKAAVRGQAGRRPEVRRRRRCAFGSGSMSERRIYDDHYRLYPVGREN